MTISKVFVVGGTGNIGTALVRDLLEKGVATTVLVRDPSKASKLFGNNEKLNIIQGDYTTLDVYKDNIAGHERLFIQVSDMINMPKIKTTFAKIAYEAGVKQVVDISSGSVSAPWRKNVIATAHYYAEKNIYELPDRGFYVALRPTGFFSNHFFGDNKTVQFKGALFGAEDPDHKTSWISPDDIAQLAANILTEPVEKHVDMVYDMTSVRVSGNDRAAAISRVLGREIKYVQIPFGEAHKNFMEHAHMPHCMVYGFLESSNDYYPVNPGLATVLHREPETLEQWFTANKNAFV